MTEASTPALVDLGDHRNITELLTRRAAAAPDHVAFDVAAGTARGRPSRRASSWPRSRPSPKG